MVDEKIVNLVKNIKKNMDLLPRIDLFLISEKGSNLIHVNFNKTL